MLKGELELISDAGVNLFFEAEFITFLRDVLNPAIII